MKMEPEGVSFDKPVTVLLSHSAAEDGANADYYDLTVQRLKTESEDLITERLSKSEGNAMEVVCSVVRLH